MSSEFERMCRIFNLCFVIILYIVEIFFVFVENIYEEEKIEIEIFVDKFNVRFILIMFVGYVIFFLIFVIYLFVMMFLKYNFFGGWWFDLYCF